MTPVQSSPLPQPSSKAASQMNAASGNQSADGQAAEPFAKVLSRRVDENDSSANKTDASKTADPASAVNSNSTSETTAPTTAPVDALAILSQIPVEMRGASIAERAALLATEGRATASIDTAALKKSDPLIPTDAALMTGTKKATDVSSADDRIQSTRDSNNVKRDDFAAELKARTNSIATEQKVASDTIRQALSNHADIAANSSPLAASQAGAAVTASQAAIAAMTGNLTGNQVSGTAQTITTPLASPAWADDFSQKISWMTSQKNQIAELHLNPPNLGPLDVVLKITDNQATALFTSPHAAVREAVENAMPKLRELLADNGIMLGNATVGDQSPRDRSAAEFSKKDADSGTARGSNAEAAEAIGIIPPASLRRHNGILDTFA